MAEILNTNISRQVITHFDLLKISQKPATHDKKNHHTAVSGRPPAAPLSLSWNTSANRSAPNCVADRARLGFLRYTTSSVTWALLNAGRWGGAVQKILSSRIAIKRVIWGVDFFFPLQSHVCFSRKHQHNNVYSIPYIDLSIYLFKCTYIEFTKSRAEVNIEVNIICYMEELQAYESI